MTSTKSEGNQMLKRLLRQLEDSGPEIIEGDRLTFKQLAQIYEEKRLFEPTITSAGKVVGLKSYKSVRRRLKSNLVPYFGSRKIKSISHSDIECYKHERLAIPPERRQEAQRSEADVNRDLQVLRNTLNFACREGWLKQNPFALGEPLISTAVETQRERVLGREEEMKLLLACTGPRRHLKPLLVAALDSACRRGELFRLQWKHVDLVNKEITIVARNAKTAKARTVPISARLYAELTQLKNETIDDPELRIFPFSDVKKSFVAACKSAGIEDFRFHDCRHTGISRWVAMGMPEMQIKAISGHSQMSTFSRYANVDREMIRRIGEAMDEWHSMEVEQRSELVN